MHLIFQHIIPLMKKFQTKNNGSKISSIQQVIYYHFLYTKIYGSNGSVCQTHGFEEGEGSKNYTNNM